jgi:hypothetical protein
MFGDFSSASIEWLREVAEADESRPVLALHRINAGVGIFHCVHDGFEYTTKYPISNLQQQCYNHTVNGTPVLLAVQGVSDRPIWTGSAPTKEEINKYIDTDIDYGNDTRPSLVKSLEFDLACMSSTKIPLYSADITIADRRGVEKKLFVYYEPDTHGGLSEENLSCGRGPYVRTKVVADLSLAGYWHSRIRGVCFRSYLRGHHSMRNIWTGSTIGWHSSPTSVPAYSNDPPNLSLVNEVFLVNGLKTADELASYDAQVSSKGVVVISNGVTQFYNNSVRLSYDLIPSIYSYNQRRRHTNVNADDSFLKVPYPGMTPDFAIDREEAYRNIESYINGLNIRFGW